MWAVLGKFFQSLPILCEVSPDVTSPDVTDSREKRNQGQFDLFFPIIARSLWSFPRCNFLKCN